MSSRGSNPRSVLRSVVTAIYADATPEFGSAEAWRVYATDVYCKAIAAIHLPAVTLASFNPGIDIREAAAAWTAWSLTFAAAVLRKPSNSVRVWLLVVAVWLYSGAMLLHGGIFMNFRVALMGTPLAALILAGVRQGLAVGAINLAIVGGAMYATSRGWLRQDPPRLVQQEWSLQFVSMLAVAAPQLLLLAWFSHHLASAIRRERSAASRLEAEAARREQLESEVLVAGERESQRIGGELHDGVCQDLAALLLRTKRAQRSLEAAQRHEADMLRGWSAQEIARDMELSVRTVETYYARILVKLSLGNRRDLRRSATDWVRRNPAE